MASAQSLANDVGSIIATNVESYIAEKDNFLMRVTIHQAGDDDAEPHELIYGYSQTIDEFTLIHSHNGFDNLTSQEERVLVAMMERVKGAQGIYRLQSTTVYGTIYHLINAKTQDAQLLFIDPDSDGDATETTIRFGSTTVFENLVPAIREIPETIAL
jgi:hypothetical protein